MIYIDNLTVFNGVELSRWVLVDDIKRPVQPKRKVTTTFVPGQQVPHVSIDGFEPYTITLHARLRKHALAEVVEYRRALTQALLANKPARLILPDDTSRSYLAIYQGDDTISIFENKTELELTFLIIDPIAYGARHSQAVYARSDAPLNIGGTQPTYPTFTLTTHTSGVTTIKKYHNNKFTHYLNVHTDTAGTIIIDCEQESVTHTGGGKAYVDLASDFFTLEAGDMVVPSITEPDKLIVTWEDRYV